MAINSVSINNSLNSAKTNNGTKGNTTTSDRNYTDMINGGTGKPNKVYNAVFSKGDEDQLSISQFFDMMILQLTNQDFMNPVDDTQYLSQMAQFATMQEMMDLCQFSKQNYVMSMLGKEVTVSQNQIGGKASNVTGIVEKIALENDEYKIYIDGKAYDLKKVKQIGQASGKNVAAEDDELKSEAKPGISDTDKAEESEKTETAESAEAAEKTEASAGTQEAENTDVSKENQADG